MSMTFWMADYNNKKKNNRNETNDTTNQNNYNAETVKLLQFDSVPIGWIMYTTVRFQSLCVNHHQQKHYEKQLKVQKKHNLVFECISSPYKTTPQPQPIIFRVSFWTASHLQATYLLLDFLLFLKQKILFKNDLLREKEEK